MFAIVFPGQGAQEVGMLSELRRAHEIARQTFEEADDALGFSLSRIIDDGPEARLRETEITQPAILAASIAAFRVLEPQLPCAPVLLAGHSLGEYSALVAAGALPFSQALRIVHQRGRFMQEAVPIGRGEMAAVLGLAGERVAEICEGIAGEVAPANYNSPEQTVIAGETQAVQAATEALREAGAKRTIPLDVSAPFHCQLMRPAMERLVSVLEDAEFSEARIPVVSNVTAEPYRLPEDARRLLGQQVCASVRWVDCVKRIQREGAQLLLEVGPGKVLSGLAARIDRGLKRANVSSPETLEAALKALAEVAG